MTSRNRPSFWRAYARLSEPNRLAAQRAYALFAQNPNHPSLRFKKLGGSDRVWSVRINEQCRAIGDRRSDIITWVWVGTHNEFDNLFG